MTEIKLPIHAGMHKTASSFLQTKIFPILFPEVPVDRNGRINNVGSTALYISENVRTSKLDWADQRKMATTKFISAESLSGRQQVSYPGESWERFKRFKEALEHICETPYIVLVIREHKSWLLSAYLHQYRRGTMHSFKEFVSSFSADDLNWSKRIELLREYPLLVLLYDDLKSNTFSTIAMMVDFWGIDRSYLNNIKLSEGTNPNQAPTMILTLKALRLYSLIILTLNYFLKKTFFKKNIDLDKLLNSNRVQDRIIRVMEYIKIGQRVDSVYTLTNIPKLGKEIEGDWLRAKEMASRP